MCCDFLPLFNNINKLMQNKERIIVAIDGNSAAGKSSLAALLKSVYACNIFSMDDFFLQPFQRTPERLNEPGGNVDYERFGKEIIEPLKSGGPFIYKAYNCQTGELSRPVIVSPHQLNIIEGVYSLHPHFVAVYDIKVFLSLNHVEQRRRLSSRNAELFNRFIKEWIPMENKYFKAFQIPAKCDIVFHVA